MLGLIDVTSTLQIYILHLNINTSDTFISNIQRLGKNLTATFQIRTFSNLSETLTE